MLLKAIYLLFAISVDLLMYIILHKKTWLKKDILICWGSTLAIFVLMHLFNLSFLWPFNSIKALILVSIGPLITHFWFNYTVIKRIDKVTTPQNEGFMATGKSVVSFVFLKIVYAMTLLMQLFIIAAAPLASN
ncbi:hypothetical protein AAFN85_11620 [Mucilaginibacter sp. CAU 1740]|uniref:hypothetical protein n=1 Tax=Mucilaginibacter sp. CAU 1740 TaxID=3140365 RepID=UPI00325BBC5B